MDIHWHNIAALAYAEFVKARRKATPDVRILDRFEDLGDDLQAAWIAAVQEGCRVFGIAVTA